VEITQASPHDARLRPEKGINLPDTELGIPALTGKNLEKLHTRLRALGADHLVTVLKIEPRQGLENLPRTLLPSLRHTPAGIMVARGDLAVEVDFERLTEVQEEILWLCEAAHVPEIWATQVREGMTRRGMPSRAGCPTLPLACARNASCLINKVNKEPRIVETVDFLGGHHAKRLPMMRRLAVSGDMTGRGREVFAPSGSPACVGKFYKVLPSHRVAAGRTSRRLRNLLFDGGNLIFEKELAQVVL
jgi:pyruvate kinase